MSTDTRMNKLKKKLIIAGVVFALSILGLLILPHFIVGEEVGGQHMGRSIITDENGNEIEVDVPGIIEYRIEYTPLEEALSCVVTLCAFVAPVSAVVLLVFVIKYIKQSKAKE